jgi:hypothetical protein
MNKLEVEKLRNMLPGYAFEHVLAEDSFRKLVYRSRVIGNSISSGVFIVRKTDDVDIHFASLNDAYNYWDHKTWFI